MNTVHLNFWISNNGDGSASIRVEPSAEAAKQRDEKQQEEGEGWGESCNGSVELKTEDGKIFYRDFDRWIELKE